MNKNMVVALLGLAGSVAVGTAVASPGDASTASANGAEPASGADRLEEITVTATRVEANVQDIPIAITAISGDALRKLGISDPSQLSGLAPNVTVDQGYANGRTHVSIRGMSDPSFALEGNSPIGISLDDVFQPYQFGLSTQIFDVNRIEVLRGPQGTLLGKNTTGGSLNYYSQTPTQSQEGYVDLRGNAGDYNRYSAEGAINLPLTDTLATRLSARVDRRDSYITNLMPGGADVGQFSTESVRLQFAWRPAVDTRVNLKLYGVTNTGDAPVYYPKYLSNPCPNFYYECDNAGNPSAPPANIRQTFSNKPQRENYNNYGGTLNVEQRINGYQLSSIANIQWSHYDLQTNDYGIAADPGHSRQKDSARQYSEELRLATPSSYPVHGVVGAFFQYDELIANEGTVSTAYGPGADYALDNYNDQTTRTYAVFSSLTYDISKMFSLVAGGRYTTDHRSAVLGTIQAFSFVNAFGENDNVYSYLAPTYQPLPGDVDSIGTYNGSWSRWTWDATANFKPADDVLAYGKVSTGYRSGGFFNGPAAGTSPFIKLKPETVISYEVGAKTEFLQHRLRINGDVFLMNYSDMQVQTTDPTSPTGLGLDYSNAASSKIKGAELEVDFAPVKALLLRGSVGYTSAKFQRYDTVILEQPVSLAGKSLPFAPRWTGNLGASYEVAAGADRSFTFDTDWTYKSQYYFDPPNITTDSAHYMGSFRVGYGETADKGWRITGFVNNVLNEKTAALAYYVAAGPSVVIEPTVYGALRTYGIEFSEHF